MTAPPILLTPGPLTTAPETRRAMLVDWGSWDDDFRALNRRVCQHLEAIAGPGDGHVCVPMQGCGTMAVEAAIGTLLPRAGKLLVLVNGAYGHRMVKLAATMGRAVETYETAEDTPPDPAELARRLAADPAISHVGVIHCETSTGILNPLEDLAGVTAAAGRKLIVDAMSTFAALPLDMAELKAVAVVASANKCLEGVPGLGFALCDRADLEGAAGNAQSLSLDLHDQWTYMQATGQYRYTPPTHVVAALDVALARYEAEGGRPARLARYRDNCRRLLEGMAELGFISLLDRAVQAPIIATFLSPRDPSYRFADFYRALKARGFIIYPGKTTKVDSFRIGCIGAIGPGDMDRLVAAVAGAMADLGIADTAPVETAPVETAPVETAPVENAAAGTETDMVMP